VDEEEEPGSGEPFSWSYAMRLVFSILAATSVGSSVKNKGASF
jgi:hypothetical protein